MTLRSRIILLLTKIKYHSEFICSLVLTYMTELMPESCWTSCSMIPSTIALLTATDCTMFLNSVSPATGRLNCDYAHRIETLFSARLYVGCALT